MGSRQTCTDCAAALGRPLLDAPHAKQISETLYDPWRLCNSLAPSTGCPAVCAIPRGVDKTLPFWSAAFCMVDCTSSNRGEDHTLCALAASLTERGLKTDM